MVVLIQELLIWGLLLSKVFSVVKALGQSMVMHSISMLLPNAAEWSMNVHRWPTLY